MEYHWGKHHRTYVNNMNKQIEGTDLDGKPLEEVRLAVPSAAMQMHTDAIDNPGCAVRAAQAQRTAPVQIIKSSWNNGSPSPVFNNAAQVWNHTFFWEGMAPGAGGEPTGKLADAIKSSFGSFDEFKSQFSTAGATQFGSGWAWLLAKPDGSLEVDKTANAVCPLVEGALRALAPQRGVQSRRARCG